MSKTMKFAFVAALLACAFVANVSATEEKGENTLWDHDATDSTIALAFVALALLLIYVGLCWWKGRDAVTTHPDHGYAL